MQLQASNGVLGHVLGYPSAGFKGLADDSPLKHSITVKEGQKSTGKRPGVTGKRPGVTHEDRVVACADVDGTKAKLQPAAPAELGFREQPDFASACDYVMDLIHSKAQLPKAKADQVMKDVIQAWEVRLWQLYEPQCILCSRRHPSYLKGWANMHGHC